MANTDNKWHLNRQINLAVIVQLLLLASLIIGSWVNIQNRISLLQHDVNNLLKYYEKFEKEINTLSSRTVTFEYRLRNLENLEKTKR